MGARHTYLKSSYENYTISNDIKNLRGCIKLDLLG